VRLIVICVVSYPEEKILFKLGRDRQASVVLGGWFGNEKSLLFGQHCKPIY